VNEVVGLDAVAPRALAPSTLTRGLGVAALAACVLASSWLALGAADSRYLLELPTGSSPHWIAGPLMARGEDSWAGAAAVAAAAVKLTVGLALPFVLLGAARSRMPARSRPCRRDRLCRSAAARLILRAYKAASVPSGTSHSCRRALTRPSRS
jgi:hypothetical protein